LKNLELKAMKKVDSKPHKETLEEEVKRLRKENAKLKSQKAAKEAKLKENVSSTNYKFL
jgi:hypothetical protein